ncbi:hypothetical protein [Roseospira goensis]|uniref:Uncharacterized protein n=1 Tax=Roseospira goensis TaxID=391922 RepID=A0A7W6WLY3_9PROT|nr:hypothetical protein [Roseospira goensis]MBB4287866.1 hypothetical protein [Roseospira goensis]
MTDGTPVGIATRPNHDLAASALARESARIEAHLRAFARRRAEDLTRPYRRRARAKRVARYALAVLSGAVMGAVAAGF